MRLYARVLVLEQADGDRVALVVADLPHVSLLLQRRVAAQTRELGIGVDRLLLSASHTHAGVGHMSEAAGYNREGSIVHGFDAEILDSVSTRIARAIHRAVADLVPARIGWGSRPVWGQTRIRSLPAMLRNVPRPQPVMPPPAGLPPEYALVDPMLTMLRVDRWNQASGAFEAAGAWSVFALHATGNAPVNQLLDADLPGMIAQSVERYIGPGAMYLFASGSGGDVSPDWPSQSRCPVPRFLPEQQPIGPFARARWSWVSPGAGEQAGCQHAARRAMTAIAARISATAESLFTELQDSLKPEVRIERAFVTLDLRAQAESLGICDAPIPGMATFGGAADARTRFYGWHWLGLIHSGMEESPDSPRSPRGCQAEKRLLLWEGATKQFISKQLPRVAQFMVLRIGSRLLAVVPFEVTTMAARQMRDSMVAGAGSESTGLGNTLVVSLSNGYLEYVATADEYTAQYYEGASTLYGPGSATMLARSAARLARSLSRGDTLPAVVAPPVRVSPGGKRKVSQYQGDPQPMVEKGWCSGDTLYARLALGRRGGWLVRDSTEEGEPLVEIRGERPAAPTVLASDNDPNVELYLSPERSSPWELRWSAASPGWYAISVRGSRSRATARCGPRDLTRR
jgi:neutral ceramidase